MQQVPLRRGHAHHPTKQDLIKQKLNCKLLLNNKNNCDLLVKELAQMQVPSAHKLASN
jgi:hypothetical protein